MIALIPIGHGEGRIRSWPIVTGMLILACVLVYLFTFERIEKQENEIGMAENAMLGLKAEAYLNTHLTKGGDVITAVVDENAGNYFELMKGIGKKMDKFWEAFTAGEATAPDDPFYLRYLMQQDALEQARAKAFVYQYGLIPAHPTWQGFFGSMFIHGGLGHLLANMLFLFFMGYALEDVWGKPAYLLFYLLCGVGGGAAFVLAQPDLTEPAIGASAAISGLMGGFLARFARTKIRFAYYYMLIRIHKGQIDLPAWSVLPVWFGGQLLYARLSMEQMTNVAYWAHIGGFATGLAIGLVLTVVGFGHNSIREDEETELRKMTGKEPVELSRARALAAQGRYEEARQFLDDVAQQNPDSLPVRRERVSQMLAEKDEQGARTEVPLLARAYFDAGNIPDVAHLIDETLQAFPSIKIDPRILMRIGSFFEEQWDNERALLYYDAVAETGGPTALKAMLAKARLLAVRMRNPKEGAAVYRRIVDENPLDPVAEIARVELNKLGDV